MTVSAHPSPGALLDHASGALPTAPGLVIATHMQFCAECRRALGVLEDVGGALLRALAPADLKSDALATALERIEQPPTDPTATLLELGARRFEGFERWVAAVGARRVRGWRALMVRAPAGRTAQRRARPGMTFVCVLEGGLRHEAQIYSVGDFMELEGGRSHRFALEMDKPFLGLVASQSAWRGPRKRCC